jgi:hypothetical protein
MAVPGMGNPARDGTTALPGILYLYIGHVPAFYLDYLDTATQETLAVVPGGSYSMVPVNSRAGLTVPPPDSCWLTATNRFAPRLVFFRPPVPEPQPPPEVLALDALYEPADALARARIRNANLQAFLAQGGRLGGN